jgi:acyl-CoA synthetase (AMP-forming)/AMP-acid ligase II
MEQLRELPFSSITGALDYQARIRPEKNAVFYPDPNTNSTEYASLTYKQYNNVTNHLAEKISKYLPSLSVSNKTVTCGLLAAGDFGYFLAEYALLKLPNVITFPISSRNSQAAVEHLMKKTKTALLLTTSHYMPMIESIQQQEEFQSLKILLLDSDEFNTEDLLKKKDMECTTTFGVNPVGKKNDEELNKTVLIIHR